MMAVAATAAQLVAMLCLGLGFATAAISFGVPVTLMTGVAAYAAGTALSATVPTPAGIGSTEAALVGTLILAGASMAEALPIVLVFRAVVLLAPVAAAAVIAGVWVCVRWSARWRRRAEPAPVELLPAPNHLNHTGSNRAHPRLRARTGGTVDLGSLTPGMLVASGCLWPSAAQSLN
jgi:hypothetical protein